MNRELHIRVDNSIDKEYKGTYKDYLLNEIPNLGVVGSNPPDRIVDNEEM